MVRSLNACPITVVSICVIGLLLGAITAPVATAGSEVSQTVPETDNTLTRIHVYDNGSARWTIQIRTRLDSEEGVSEYEAFRTRFRNATSRYLDPFRGRMRGVVASAANATGAKCTL